MKTNGTKNKWFLFIIAVFLFIPLSQASAGIGDGVFANDGEVDPGSFYQRYRRSEYSETDPFFQWWYFTIKDLENNRYFAMTYSVIDTVNNPSREGSGVMFAMIDREQQTGFHKYESYNINQFSVENDFDVAIDSNPTDQEIEYEIQVIDDNTYRVKGKMHTPSAVSFIDGKLNGTPVDPGLYVEWDFTIHRIYGWYGQPDMEEFIKTSKVISWNTYAHSAEVEGYIQVGDTVYDLARNTDFRAYGDSNWGVNYPSGEPYIDYPWGWYYVGAPSDNSQQEFSVIAGIGRQDTNSISGIVEGKFADVRLDADTHIGLRQMEAWKKTPDDDGYSAVEKSNDGDVLQFKVDRDQWEIFEDSLGQALIPLHQKVTLESFHYLVELDFYSEVEDYFRLLVFHEDYEFSDFEALGVDVHVTITYHWWGCMDHFPFFCTWQEEVIRDFWSDDGGLEYGYRIDGLPIP